MFYLKLSGGPGGVATADAEARVVDGAVAPIAWEIWVTKYSNMNSSNGSFKQKLIHSARWIIGSFHT